MKLSIKLESKVVNVKSNEYDCRTSPPKTATNIAAAESSNIDLRRILVVTDFSANSRKTYAYAARLAKRFNVAIHLVHFGCNRAPELSEISSSRYFVSARKALAKEVRHVAFADRQIRTSLLEINNVGRSLNLLYDEFPFQLIVSHTLSHKGMQRNFDHLLAEKIVANAKLPVLLFGPAAFDSGIEQPKSVLIPFDFSDKAEATFPALRILGTHYQCSFRMLFVQTVRSHWIKKSMGTAGDQIQSLGKRFEELISAELSTFEVELEIQQGLPALEFCNRACDSSADLIVIGTYGRLGKLTQRIIRHATCPVMAVPTNHNNGY